MITKSSLLTRCLFTLGIIASFYSVAGATNHIVVHPSRLQTPARTGEIVIANPHTQHMTGTEIVPREQTRMDKASKRWPQVIFKVKDRSGSTGHDEAQGGGYFVFADGRKMTKAQLIGLADDNINHELIGASRKGTKKSPRFGILDVNFGGDVWVQTGKMTEAQIIAFNNAHAKGTPFEGLPIMRSTDLAHASFGEKPRLILSADDAGNSLYIEGTREHHWNDGSNGSGSPLALALRTTLAKLNPFMNHPATARSPRSIGFVLLDGLVNGRTQEEIEENAQDVLNAAAELKAAGVKLFTVHIALNSDQGSQVFISRNAKGLSDEAQLALEMSSDLDEQDIASIRKSFVKQYEDYGATEAMAEEKIPDDAKAAAAGVTEAEYLQLFVKAGTQTATRR